MVIVWLLSGVVVGFLSAWYKPRHSWEEEILTEGLPPSNSRAFLD